MTHGIIERVLHMRKLLIFITLCLFSCSAYAANDSQLKWNVFTQNWDEVQNLTRSGTGVVYWGGEAIKIWDSFDTYISPTEAETDVQLEGDLSFSQALSIENVVNLGFVGDDITFDGLDVTFTGAVLMSGLKSGTTQAGAGAAANELWVDTDDDNTLKVGT